MNHRGIIRDVLRWLIAFSIVACATTPLPTKKPEGAPGARVAPVVPIDTRAHEAQLAAAARFEELHATRTARGIALTLAGAAFDRGGAQLKPDAIRTVDELAQFLAEHPERRVLIEAFTDSDGSNAYNIELSQSRADSVAMTLIHHGIDARRLAAIGFGERFPVAKDGSEAGRERNRRVEITVTRGAEAIPYRVITAALKT